MAKRKDYRKSLDAKLRHLIGLALQWHDADTTARSTGNEDDAFAAMHIGESMDSYRELLVVTHAPEAAYVIMFNDAAEEVCPPGMTEKQADARAAAIKAEYMAARQHDGVGLYVRARAVRVGKEV
jgi:hypothetical protein